MSTLSKQELAALFDGLQSWEDTRQIISRPKDDDRFQRSLEVLQERVEWPEKILLPLTDHLYIVQRASDRIVKCDCGQEYGDWRKNWKLSALILVRDDEASLREIYPGQRQPDPVLCEIREYICPGCGALLKVESVPVGYPVIFDVLPDLDTFYRDWLGQALPDTKEFVDKSEAVISQWAEAISHEKV